MSAVTNAFKKMAKINFVIDPINTESLTGGMICILRYAKGLTEKGHDVSLFSILPSKTPPPLSNGIKFIHSKKKQQWTSLIKSAGQLLRDIPKIRGSHECRRQLLFSINRLIESGSVLIYRQLPYAQRRAISLNYSESKMPDGDITIATGFQTALPVFLYGKGEKFYFSQHFEPYFKNEFLDAKLAEAEALLSYHLGLQIIANSSWLSGMLHKQGVTDLDLCLNAVDQKIFSCKHPPKNFSENRNEYIIISYGGRNAEWKGFLDIAEAVKLVRERNKTRNIRWRVFGTSLLPPQNEIANYEPVGYVAHHDLAQHYREADVLVSASWYESFPLFPLEAMACGTAVVTTPFGTEEYAIQGETAEVVPPKNPGALANAIEKLLEDANYRISLSRAGAEKALDFTWGRSVEKMESILLKKTTQML